MKKYNSFTLQKKWFAAIEDNNIWIIKEMLRKGFDVNTKDQMNNTALIKCSDEAVCDEIVYILLQQPNIDINAQDLNGYTALHSASENEYTDDILHMLLIHPKIDVFITDVHGRNFIDYLIYNEIDYNHLKDYSLQKKIIENNPNNIIIFQKYNIVNPKIKEENPDLFKAKDWGLIS